MAPARLKAATPGGSVGQERRVIRDTVKLKFPWPHRGRRTACWAGCRRVAERATGDRGRWPKACGTVRERFGDGSRTIRGRFGGEARSDQAGEPGDGAEPGGGSTTICFRPRPLSIGRAACQPQTLGFDPFRSARLMNQNSAPLFGSSCRRSLTAVHSPFNDFLMSTVSDRAGST